MNRSWHVRTRFFQDEEVAQLLPATKKLLPLEAPWHIAIIDKERSIAGKGPLNVLKTISALSKPYMNIQRYKGLGEMNPEQLWETSMNAETRTLLQVSIVDGLNAEKWFNDLMGDDVSARKQFIEENGQFVKNLDI